MPSTFRPTKTRRQLHQELEAQMSSFLDQGGKVDSIPQGISGRPFGSSPLFATFDGESPDNRTLVNDVVAAIEARKKPLAKPEARRPRKKIIMDDFGQPIRWEWTEE